MFVRTITINYTILQVNFINIIMKSYNHCNNIYSLHKIEMSNHYSPGLQLMRKIKMCAVKRGRL